MQCKHSTDIDKVGSREEVHVWHRLTEASHNRAILKKKKEDDCSALIHLIQRHMLADSHIVLLMNEIDNLISLPLLLSDKTHTLDCAYLIFQPDETSPNSWVFFIFSFS